MTAARQIPAGLIEKQIVASDPAISAWVSANAGSGKTHVLTQRVIRLLLDGVDPGKILCLTFTKAAAANMANRVFDTLAKWTALDDAALDAAILGIEGRAPSATRRQRARRLFAEALETPGGLKVQTIHAFCTALLHQFPFEAGVAAHFDVLEERAERELIDRLRIAVLLEASAAKDSLLGRALMTAITTAADITFAELVRDAIAQRAALEGWISDAGDIEAALVQLSRLLGVDPMETLAQVEAELFSSPHVPVSEWPAVMQALTDGSAADREHIARLRSAQSGVNSTRIDAYLDVFCTDDRDPRKRLLTKGFSSRHPRLTERLLKEQERVCALLERRKAILMRERTVALVRIADAVLQRYRAEKNRRGLLDYDDLIEKTLTLLSGDGSAAWVMYKLDLGIDHLLIDEAQDTSPPQWDVIRRLTAEFTAGAGARADVRRSIFAVGDEKQSIYSFQGAQPRGFDEMRKHFAGLHDASAMAFERVPLLASFRSSPDILGAVDEVFARPQAYSGLTADPVRTVHEAVRHNAPGFVEIWPMIAPEKKAELEPWDAPFDTMSDQHPQVKLARRIAAAVRSWIARGERVGDQRRAVRPGDILILVRQRGPLFQAIIRALKDARVDVAGADRLMLTEHIAVMDLMSLADALLLPQDDLALAEVLRSPLFGFDDDQLFVLAHGRGGSLRGALRRKSSENALFSDAAEQLDRLARDARVQTPFMFYAQILGAGGGRRKMVARLGPEAADALDEFLALALDYESRNTPSLQGFIAWLRAAETQVKRDMDIVRDEVRVMTVHGAKGLEAPIVVLADTTTPPAGPRDPRLFQLAAAGGAAHSPMVWAGARAGDVSVVADARATAREAAEAEYRRLLYVAMTRAADRLVVCGARGIRAAPQGCWYQLVSDALEPSAIKMPADDGDGTIRRWRKSDAETVEPPAENVIPDGPRERELPAWLTQDAPPAKRGPLVIAPSAAFEWHVGRRPAGAAGEQEARRARARGVSVHKLLQALPDVPAAQRADAARRFLSRRGQEIDEHDIEAILTNVLGILAHPSFALLFAEGTRAEAPVVGLIARPNNEPVHVSGQIDRLAVTADCVLIADYKTDRAPPQRSEDVPQAYCMQLALYRAVIGRLYPNRPVRAAIVYTESAQLFEIPQTSMRVALASLGIDAP